MGRAKYKGVQGNFGCDSYIDNLDGGESLTSLCLCQISSTIHFKYVQFIVPQFYVNKALKKKKAREKKIEPSQLKCFNTGVLTIFL